MCRLGPVRSGNRNATDRVFGRIAVLSMLASGWAEAPPPASLPAPLASLIAKDPHANVSILARGIPGAQNPRLQRDGSLLFDAPGDSLEYHVMPRPDGGADVWLAARELRAQPNDSSNAVATPVNLGPGPRLDAASDAAIIREAGLPRETLALAQSIARESGTATALASDGTLYVAELETGIVYRVALPVSARPSLRRQLPRAGFAR
jgi:hypothetical protein